jgi:tetratricopeptide (TPR) repeat protein
MIPWGHSRALLAPRSSATVAKIGLAAAIELAAVAASPTVLAQSETAAGTAEALFRQAVGLAKQGQYQQAIAKFQASYELDPARGTLLGWAMSEERAGKLAGALGHYQQLRDLARQAGDDRREQVATRRIVELLPRVPTLTITAAAPLPESTVLRLNGRTLPRGALDTQLPLDPGEYELLAEAADGGRFAKRISLSEGARESVHVELSGRKAPRSASTPVRDKAAQPAPDDVSGWTALRSTGFVLGVVGLGGLGAGGYFWVQSGNTYENVRAACPAGVCPPEQQEAINEGRTQERVAQVAFILGGVFLATGVTLFVVGGPSSRAAQETAAIAVTPQWVGVMGRL